MRKEKSKVKIKLIEGTATWAEPSGLINSGTWNYLKNSIDQLDYDYLIKTSYLLKSEIVKKDPFEKNTRKKLNFGHTIAHAIESYLLERNKPILHGFAVAKGIIIESYIAYRQNLLSQKEFEEIEHQINFRFGNYFNFEINVNELIKLLKFDKKNTCKTINFSLPTAIGNVTVNHEIELNKVKSFLVEFLQND